MSSETAMSYAWIDSTLRGDAQLMAASIGGVWQGRADVGTIGPYAQFGRQSGSDTETINAIRLMVHILCQIKAVGPVSNFAGLNTIANRIDELFKNVRNVGVSGGAILACYRESELAYDEPGLVGGKAWTNLGGLYHLEVQSF